MLTHLQGEKSPVHETYETIRIGYETCKTHRYANFFSNMEENVSQIAFADKKDESDSNPFAEGKWSRARIQILYPHPNGSRDKGLARLIVSRYAPSEANNEGRKKLSDQIVQMASRLIPEQSETEEPAKKRDADKASGQEIWELALPKEELDILLAELSHRGFFENQERPRGEAKVEVQLDHNHIAKRWTNEPRLEALMLQVYNDGILSAFGQKTEPIATRFASNRKQANDS